MLYLCFLIFLKALKSLSIYYYFQNLRNEVKYTQNFVKESLLVEKLITEKTSITKDDYVVELGAGTGKITSVLIKHAGKVLAIEKDRQICGALINKFHNEKNLKIICADLLRFSVNGLGAYKTFSNIPFNLTSEIVKRLYLGPNPPIDGYFFMQREAAFRFMGDYYDHSRYVPILLKPFFKLKVIHEFKRDDFFPMPGVEIVLIHFEKIKQPKISIDKKDAFYDFIAFTFANYKGTAKTSFTKIFTNEQLKRLGDDLHINWTKSIASLKFDQWIKLFDYYMSGVEASKKKLVDYAYKKTLLQAKFTPKVERRTRVHI